MQLKLWGNVAETFPDQMPTTREPVKLFVDGASRGNPGEAGAGIVITLGGARIFQDGFYLGRGTNNEAEYWALLLGLQKVIDLSLLEHPLFIFSDSQLLVRQIRGEYRVKNLALRRLFDRAQGLLRLCSYTIVHVLREYNKEADAMANKGVDEHAVIPLDMLERLGLAL
ncbi:MAG: Ribonuclease H [candidate division TM6 bacterium GW2011_GWF2_43_17]|nr:MAG: Ribonuclease H [candidate division TM6 bacterium GW2011_GWF2_43_17]